MCRCRITKRLLEGGIKGLRVGIPKEYRIDGAPPEIDALWAKGAEWLKAQGAEIVEVSPAAHQIRAARLIISWRRPKPPPTWRAMTACASAIARQGAHDITELYEKSRAEGFGAEVQRRILIGTYVLSAGYYDAYYARAQKLRTLIARDFDAGVREMRRAAHPGHARARPSRVGDKTADPVAMYLQRRLHRDGESGGPAGHCGAGRPDRERLAAGPAADRQGVRRGDGAARRPGDRTGRGFQAQARPNGGRHERACEAQAASRARPATGKS